MVPPWIRTRIRNGAPGRWRGAVGREGVASRGARSVRGAVADGAGPCPAAPGSAWACGARVPGARVPGAGACGAPVTGAGVPGAGVFPARVPGAGPGGVESAPEAGGRGCWGSPHCSSCWWQSRRVALPPARGRRPGLPASPSPPHPSTPQARGARAAAAPPQVPGAGRGPCHRAVGRRGVRPWSGGGCRPRHRGVPGTVGWISAPLRDVGYGPPHRGWSRSRGRSRGAAWSRWIWTARTGRCCGPRTNPYGPRCTRGSGCVRDRWWAWCRRGRTTASRPVFTGACGWGPATWTRCPFCPAGCCGPEGRGCSRSPVSPCPPEMPWRPTRLLPRRVLALPAGTGGSAGARRTAGSPGRSASRRRPVP